MIICAISDTHRQSPPLREADLLVHAGDLGSYGNARELMAELAWLNTLRPRFPKGIVYVPGNHDIVFDQELVAREWALYEADPFHRYKPSITPEESVAILEFAKTLGIHVLINQAIEIEGVKFFGTPYTNEFMSWAFMGNENQLADHYAKIPDETQVLISHGPAYGMRDRCPNGFVGSQALRYVLDTRLPDLKAHIFGHIHESAGVSDGERFICWNASVLDGNYYGFNTVYTLDTDTWKLK